MSNLDVVAYMSDNGALYGSLYEAQCNMAEGIEPLIRKFDALTVITELESEVAGLGATIIGQGDLLRGVVNAIRGMPEEGTAHSVHDAVELATTTMQRIADLEAENAKLLSVLTGLAQDIQGLMDESTGVARLHLNGDIAEWSELEAGGRFERLTNLPEACAMIAELDMIRNPPKIDTSPERVENF